MVPTAKLGELLERGIYILPATGPNDEVVLFAVRTNRAVLSLNLTPIPKGADHVAAAYSLLDLLDEVDPVPAEENHARRRMEMRRV